MAIVNSIIREGGSQWRANRFGSQAVVVFSCVSDSGDFDSLGVGDSLSIVQRCRNDGTGEVIPSIGDTRSFGIGANSIALPVVDYVATKISCREVRIQVIYSNNNRWEVFQRPTIEKPVTVRYVDSYVSVPRIQIISMTAGGSEGSSEVDDYYRDDEYLPVTLMRIGVLAEVPGNLNASQLNLIRDERKIVRTLLGQRCILTSAAVSSSIISTGEAGFRVQYEWTLDAGGEELYGDDDTVVTVPAREGLYRLKWDLETKEVVQEENPNYNYDSKNTAPNGALPGAPITKIP